MVKQESQRRLRSAASPARSFSSSTAVQKQVGHTIVQLPQVRQRSATSSQRGCSRLASSSSRTSSERMCRPMLPSALRDGIGRLRRASAVSAGGAARSASRRGAALAADLHQEFMPLAEQFGQRKVEAGLGLRAGVHRRAEAGAARLAAVHRDDERALAPRLVVRIDIRPLQEHAVLDGDGVQFAGAHGEEGVALRRLRRCGDRHAVSAFARRATAAAAADAGSASRHAGRHRSRTAPRRRAGAGGSGRHPARRSSRRAGRRPIRCRHRRSPDRAAAGRSRGTPRRAGRRSGRRALRA